MLHELELPFLQQRIAEAGITLLYRIVYHQVDVKEEALM